MTWLADLGTGFMLLAHTPALAGVFVFILGIVFGSFFNVIILRYQTGMTIGGRSMCFNCGKQLYWYELIPVFSYLVQFGRCRGCRSRISSQYILVELTTGLLFLVSLLVGGISFTTPYLWLVASILLLIAVYDIRHTIIPDRFVFWLGGVALIGLVVEIIRPDLLNIIPTPEPWWSVILAGVILAIPFALLWLISKGRYIGFGDVKLMVVMGWLLGLSGGVAAVLMGFWLGAIIGLGIVGFKKLMHSGIFQKHSKVSIMKAEIPFGPFLVMGTLLVAWLQFTITDIAELLAQLITIA